MWESDMFVDCVLGPRAAFAAAIQSLVVERDFF